MLIPHCKFQCIMAGWWLSHPSEKYESQLGWIVPNIWKNMFQTTKQMGNVNKKKRFLALPPPVRSIVHSCHQCVPKKQNGPNSPSEMAAVWSLRFEVAGISRFLAEVQQEFPESNVEIIGIPGNHPVAPFRVPTCANCFSRDSEDSPYLGYHDLGGEVDLTIYPPVNIQFAIENGDL